MAELDLCGSQKEPFVAKDDKKSQKKTNPVTQYFRETRSELRKVTWPTRQETINLTLVVVVVLVIMSMLLGSLDAIFFSFFGLLLGS